MNAPYITAASNRRAEQDRFAKHRAYLLDLATQNDVGIVHVYDTEYPKGGLTIAFSKANKFKSGTMVQVAVNVCSREDSFSKKLGTMGALEKFFARETIELPLLATFDASMLPYIVKNAFTALYDHV